MNIIIPHFVWILTFKLFTNIIPFQSIVYMILFFMVETTFFGAVAEISEHWGALHIFFVRNNFFQILYYNLSNCLFQKFHNIWVVNNTFEFSVFAYRHQRQINFHIYVVWFEFEILFIFKIDQPILLLILFNHKLFITLMKNFMLNVFLLFFFKKVEVVFKT